jgi:transcriptional regulator with XRE-family HTH domain
VEQNEVHQRGSLIYALRTSCDWTQEDLAKAMDMNVSVISDYEKGRRRPSSRVVHRAAAAVGATFEELRGILTYLGRMREAMESLIPLHTEKVEAVLEEAFTDTWVISGPLARAVLTGTKEGKKLSLERLSVAPELGYLLLDRLERHRMEDRKRLVDAVESYRSWDLCELLCEESRDAAEEGEDASLELADLALYIAERIPGGEELRACAQAFAWAHLGHARRQLGDRTGAEEALARFRELWHPEASLRPLLLDGARIAGLEALVSGEIGSLQ